jgi:hypothetical protein
MQIPPKAFHGTKRSNLLQVGLVRTDDTTVLGQPENHLVEEVRTQDRFVLEACGHT